VVFLLDGRTAVPEVAWAMQRAGDAVVVVHGAFRPDMQVWTDDVELPGGVVAHLRIADPTAVALEPDLVLDESMPDEKVEQAVVRAAQHPPVAKRAAAPTKPGRDTPLAWHLDATYEGEPYPSPEKRVLGLFRLWSVIHYFYPYLHLIGDDAWDGAVAEMLPRFESAADAREYAFAVDELAARIPDGHVNMSGSDVFDRARGEGRAPVIVRVIDDQVVITAIRDVGAIGDSKLAIGDVIVAADGVPIRERMARESKYIAASNDATRDAWCAQSALRGDPSAKLALTVRGADGTTRDVVVARGKSFPPATRTGPVYRLLEGGIGYADLDRLELKDVDAMFAAFENAPAIVFDMRGYPHGTAWAIAPRLNVRKAKVAAQFFEPFVSPGSPSSTFFEQEIPKTDKPLYRGKTVMLIDERTMSQAEHTGLFFEAANGTTFIGSQTAGANGDVTAMSLPGGLFVHFSGHDVRHADGRQLQRVGLVPDVPVRPTIAGLRAGRDEVLERALAFLQSGK
jgi:C-terminal processing protease CtpA/Prc